ncbi:MAG: ornithine carbamoyltransferase [Omnitrophica WOR_2 bacterium RIFCSPHIGHO2_02_FULL_68_15]|nr:MAG: ornithine carbamoyltransferase [Omnitrophica WOR_2 bacterium RIFCSPHIGHO2_02_FULL_68_15]
MHHLLSLTDLSRQEIEALFELTSLLKKRKVRVSQPLAGKTLGLVFQKPSVRTRLSFEIGMYQLGGQCAYLGPEDLGQGQRESAKDMARVLSRYVNGIAARTFAHRDVVELAQWATVPVINGLSDTHHPCQALADLFTILEHFGSLKSLKVAYVGDGNNVCHSLMHGCALLGVPLAVATPRQFPPEPAVVEEARLAAKRSGGALTVATDPKAAVAGASVIYTDVWVSMGQQRPKAQLKAFGPFQVNKTLTALADTRHVVMHCLPAHRGVEITDDVLDSPHSVVYDQAENRLHIQKAILLWLLRGARAK